MYNGYANYETWNVLLWIGNDEGLYHLAARCLNYKEFVDVLRELDDGKPLAYETPDNVSWNDSGLDHDQISDFWQESFSRVPA